jgi:hypothetical protein
MYSHLFTIAYFFAAAIVFSGDVSLSILAFVEQGNMWISVPFLVYGLILMGTVLFIVYRMQCSSRYIAPVWDVMMWVLHVIAIIFYVFLIQRGDFPELLVVYIVNIIVGILSIVTGMWVVMSYLTPNRVYQSIN